MLHARRWEQTPFCLLLQLLVKWWAEYPAELLEQHVVRPLQRYLTDELYATKKLTISVMNVIKVGCKLRMGSCTYGCFALLLFVNSLFSAELS